MVIRRLRYSSHFKRSLKKLDPSLKKGAREKLKLFLKDPFNPQLNTHKLSGKLQGYWSFSVNRKYRIMFEFLEEEAGVGLVDIGPHEIYR